MLVVRVQEPGTFVLESLLHVHEAGVHSPLDVVCHLLLLLLREGRHLGLGHADDLLPGHPQRDGAQGRGPHLRDGGGRGRRGGGLRPAAEEAREAGRQGGDPGGLSAGLGRAAKGRLDRWVQLGIGHVHWHGRELLEVEDRVRLRM